MGGLNLVLETHDQLLRAVLQTTAPIPDAAAYLVTALAGLDVNDFTHGVVGVALRVACRVGKVGTRGQ